ncbi:MBL fold metallo-hydrolase, partial [Gammaproteobacteria bacterium 42_54_T18]
MSESNKARRDANLNYPFENTPEPGELVNIVEGVNWLRMPLPFSLNHINLWAIEGVDDWTIVDTGLATDETIELWQAVHAKYGSSKSFKNLFITHMHPDHIGLAGWLTRTYKAELSITRSEYLTCRHLLDYSHKEAPQEAIDFYRAAGLDEEQLENYQ